jgi:hypothetical protein
MYPTHAAVDWDFFFARFLRSEARLPSTVLRVILHHKYSGLVNRSLSLALLKLGYGCAFGAAGFIVRVVDFGVGVFSFGILQSLLV